MFTELYFGAKLLRGGNLPPTRVHFFFSLSPSFLSKLRKQGGKREKEMERESVSTDVCAHLVGHDTKGGERSLATEGHEAPETPCRTPEVSNFLRNSHCWASFPSLVPGRTGDRALTSTFRHLHWSPSA